jgi:ATP-binding cassette subfamily F protein uup
VKPNKLSYKLKRELEALPTQIEALEARVASLESTIAAPGFYDQPFEQLQPTLDALAGTQDELDAAITRWDELETQRAALEGGEG